MDIQIIQNRIFEIRGCRVMLDFHLAELYQVETRVLNQSVKRNTERFPEDFMFRLTNSEWESMSSQIVMTSHVKRHKSSLPLAFTEHGVTMLSSILRSETAIGISIRIVRIFVAMRQMVCGYEELRRRIENLEISTGTQFSEIYQALTELLSKAEKEKPARPIGFHTYNSKSPENE